MLPVRVNAHNVRTVYKLTIQLECETQYDTNEMMFAEIYRNNRRLSQRRPTELLTFAPPQDFHKMQQSQSQIPETKSEPRSWRTAVRELMNRFGNETTIHGLNHICSKELSFYQRLLWFIAFVIALLTFIYVVILLAARFNRKQFETVIESTSYPVFKIYFPEVTVCNKNRLNWQRLEAAQRMYLRKEHQTKGMREHFAHIVGLFDNLTFGRFDLFKALPKGEVLKELNYINFTNVVDFMSWQCNEIFSSCIWRFATYNCCDIITRRRNQLGQCLAFNNVEGEEGKLMLSRNPKWPWRTGKHGPNTGLKLRIVLNEQFIFPNNTKSTGITLMIAEPYAYSDISKDIYSNTTTMIALSSIFHFYDKYTVDQHPDVRQCIFEGEQHKHHYHTLTGHKYMYENCRAECQQMYLMHFCNCTLDLFFPPAGYPICKLVDLPCLAKYNDYLTHMQQPDEKLYINSNFTGMTCKCYYNCRSLTYIPDTNYFELKDRTADEHGKGIINLNIFYGQDTVLVYRTSLVFTWVDLLVSFGGIAGLFLGCSLMSIVELGVFLFMGVPESVIHHQQQMKKQRTQNQRFKQVVHEIIKRNSLKKF